MQQNGIHNNFQPSSETVTKFKWSVQTKQTSERNIATTIMYMQIAPANRLLQGKGKRIHIHGDLFQHFMSPEYVKMPTCKIVKPLPA